MAGGFALFAVLAVLLFWSPLQSLPPEIPDAVGALLLAVNGAVAALGARRHVPFSVGYLGCFAVLILGTQLLGNNLTDATIPSFKPDLEPFAIFVGGFAITYAATILRGGRPTLS